MNLKIHTKLRGGAVVLEIGGEVDLYSSPQLRKAILTLTRKRAPHIVVDLAKVAYMDSSGVATLVEGLQQMKIYNGRFSLSGMRENVRQVFELTRLDTLFRIYQTSEAALADE